MRTLDASFPGPKTVNTHLLPHDGHVGRTVEPLLPVVPLQEGVAPAGVADGPVAVPPVAVGAALQGRVEGGPGPLPAAVVVAGPAAPASVVVPAVVVAGAPSGVAGAVVGLVPPVEPWGHLKPVLNTS